MPSRLSITRTLALLGLLCVAPFAVAAESVTGIVTNKTTNRPSAGDDVVLIRLAQGMQESTRTKSDGKGRFTLEVPDAGLHLVRVTHDKANYFRPLEPGTQSVEVEVFNAAAKVAGVSHEADVMRVETDSSGTSLHVVENFFVKNESAPPMTQFSDKAFEFYLPAGAIIEGSAALAPGGMPVQAAPVPLADAPNHYAFIFPIRPGETRFQTTYKMPYSGSLKFAPHPVTDIDTIAVILPKSMKFVPGPSAPYTGMGDEVDGQTFVARSVHPSQPLEFTLSGTGQLPATTQAATVAGAPGGGATGGATVAATQPGTAATDTRPGGGLGNPIDPEGTNDPWSKYKWWILGALGLALAAGAGVMLKSGGSAAAATATQPILPVVSTGTSGLLQALKDELFELETDRLSGRLPEQEYAMQKAALEVVLRRALARQASSAAAADDITI